MGTIHKGTADGLEVPRLSVTWTLTPASNGTLLQMEHDGFGPGNEFAFEAMSGGWARIGDKIGEIAGELA